MAAVFRDQVPTIIAKLASEDPDERQRGENMLSWMAYYADRGTTREEQMRRDNERRVYSKYLWALDRRIGEKEARLEAMFGPGAVERVRKEAQRVFGGES